jgi:hypothetical protein
MEKTRNNHKSFVGEPYMKGHSQRWKDNVKNLSEINHEDVNWIELTQVMAQWQRVSVLMMLNFEVP